MIFRKQNNGIQKERHVAPDMDVLQFILSIANGSLFAEQADGLYLYEPEEREIVPITAIGRQEKDHGIKKGNFSFTTNQNFNFILEKCAAPRTRHVEGAPPSQPWMGKHIKELLRRFNRGQHRKEYPFFRASSVEVWQDNQIVGGIIFLKMGGAVFSISSFSDANNAGKAAGVFLNKLLHIGRFIMHDCGMTSNFSAGMGGEQKSRAKAQRLRQQALSMQLDIPDIPAKIPLHKIPLITKDENGWSLPREECDASKEQVGGQKVKDFRQTGARNRGGGETGPTRPRPQSAPARGHHRRA
jgi:Leu/Phe-tRNA-protein transferase